MFAGLAQKAVQMDHSLQRNRSVGELVLPLPIARLIRDVFLPRNPRKMRGAHPDTLAAVNYYIAALEAAERAKETK